jgi:hypothetical protein
MHGLVAVSDDRDKAPGDVKPHSSHRPFHYITKHLVANAGF